MKMLRFIQAVLLTAFQYLREECEFTVTEYRNAVTSPKPLHPCAEFITSACQVLSSNKHTEETAVDNKPGSNAGRRPPGCAGASGSDSDPCAAGTARASPRGDKPLMACRRTGTSWGFAPRS